MAKWDVWGAIVGMDGVALRWAALEGVPGFVEEHADGSWTMWIDETLTATEARCVATHELLHIERETSYADVLPDTLVQPEEFRVDLEVAERMVPPEELALLMFRTLRHGPWLATVAEEWDVTEEVASWAVGLVLSPWLTGLGVRRARGRRSSPPTTATSDDPAG